MEARRYTLAAGMAVLLVASCGSWAATLTFDDVPTGTHLSAYQQSGVWFSSLFEAADHSGSSWGIPRSGRNVLVNNWSSPTGAMVKFGSFTPDGSFNFAPIAYLAGYFSTESGTTVRVAAEVNGIGEVGSVLIGDPDGAWENVFVELVPTAPASGLMFYPVSSPDALLHWCADDMTMDLIPEPSSPAALSLGLLAAGAGVRRRRRE
jgi:hypothetical protein